VREKYTELGETDHQDGRWMELAGLGSCTMVGSGRTLRFFHQRVGWVVHEPHTYLHLPMVDVIEKTWFLC